MIEPDRRNFDLEYISKELGKLEKNFPEMLNIYVVGGAVMAMDRLKAGTKDIDVIVENNHDQRILTISLEKCGYSALQPQDLSRPYKDLSATVMENSDGFRWDVFVKRVAGKLILSDNMRKRASTVYSGEKIEVFRLSKEDIFLMKGVTTRDRDLEDMYLIARSGINYDLVFEECIRQSESDITGTIWETALNEQCRDLERIYDVRVPFQRKLEKIATDKMLSKRILDALGGTSKSRRELLLELNELKPADIDAGLQILQESGKIRKSTEEKFIPNHSESENQTPND